MKKELIIFDFDGVLADSFETFYPLVKDGMEKIGLEITPEKYRSLFADNVHKGFKVLIKDVGKLNRFLSFRKINYNRYYYDPELRAKLFPEAAKSVKKISKKYRLAIASSGKKKNIKSLLKEGGIDKLFGLTLADSNHSKDKMIRKILAKFNAKPEHTLFITDTVGDIKIAKKMGLKTLAVTWGFHFPKILKKSRPDHMAYSFPQILKILGM